PCSTTTVGNTISTRTVPGHTDKQASVMSKICRPPILRVGHERMQILFYSLQVEAFKGFCIVKIFIHWVGSTRMLAQNAQFKLIGPPVAVPGATATYII